MLHFSCTYSSSGTYYMFAFSEQRGGLDIIIDIMMVSVQAAAGIKKHNYLSYSNVVLQVYDDDVRMGHIDSAYVYLAFSRSKAIEWEHPSNQAHTCVNA